MGTGKAVIIVTDGDATAYRAISQAAEALHLYPLRMSRGNPTPLRGPALVEAIDAAPAEPVVVMVDDQGEAGTGRGERALQTVLKASHLRILGVVAVASHTRQVAGVPVTVSVTRDGETTGGAVNKEGTQTGASVLRGDTVDILRQFPDVLVVGLGDPGKMGGHDRPEDGVPATEAALREILQRSGWDGNPA